MSIPDYVAAHKSSSKHRDILAHSELCGCFYCLAIFPPAKIIDWVDEVDGQGTTALCPICGIDSIIGSASGYPITEDFLRQMHRHWFEVRTSV
jgi:predicted short-subunit dehydrogenase-like oxidoreductase (DUF2520 family)